MVLFDELIRILNSYQLISTKTKKTKPHGLNNIFIVVVVNSLVLKIGSIGCEKEKE